MRVLQSGYWQRAAAKIARPRVLALLLFLAAFGVLSQQLSHGALGAGFEEVTIARNLAAEGSFANPYSLYRTGPTAHMAPIHPLFLAIIIRLFGLSSFGALLISCGILTAFGLQIALLPTVSSMLFGSRVPGMIAACLGILLPIFQFTPHSEYMYCALGLMLFCLFVNRSIERKGAGPAVACGFFLGFLVLLNPASFPVELGWLGYLWWRKKPPEPMRFALLLLVGFLVVQAPWTWRNYRVLHTFVFVRDNLGLELAVSNNDRAAASFVWNTAHGVYFPLHPCCSQAQADRLRQVGEGRYVQERMREALQWIRTHPKRFFELTLARCRLFWSPTVPENSRAFSISITFLSFCSWMAVVLMGLRRQPTAAFFSAVFLFYPMVYYLAEFDERYRVSILWLLLLATGYLLERLWRAGPQRGDAYEPCIAASLLGELPERQCPTASTRSLGVKGFGKKEQAFLGCLLRSRSRSKG